jgi:hypothetical protein
VVDPFDADPPLDLTPCVLVGLRHRVALRFLSCRLGAGRHGAGWLRALAAGAVD